MKSGDEFQGRDSLELVGQRDRLICYASIATGVPKVSHLPADRKTADIPRANRTSCQILESKLQIRSH